VSERTFYEIQSEGGSNKLKAEAFRREGDRPSEILFTVDQGEGNPPLIFRVDAQKFHQGFIAGFGLTERTPLSDPQERVSGERARKITDEALEKAGLRG
jgi:hypothetical protein